MLRLLLAPDKSIPEVKTPQASQEILLSLYQEPQWQTRLSPNAFSEIQASDNSAMETRCVTVFLALL